ncbi:hypothetical protein [Rodentibacter trehalosifermentans]|uniref:hypothetical protein n=1 Tax=Rodentibacter trehalosifermentans TaxID=1908263 RepID=UPI0009840E4B|nr:hypothetical protein [Rodentibacter trehalosifermentans]OOF53560.1 hypothetical protein BKK53_00880 [Rodentibacter trehalosifermentans]
MARIKKDIATKSKGKIRLSNSSQVTVENNDKKPPVFSFHKIEKNYGLSNCEANEKVALVETLHKLSQFTWQELRNNPRHGLGTEKIEHLAIKGCKVPDFIKEQNISLIAFRFNGKSPMVGYRENQIFHILWLDRNFTLYDHGS